MQSAQMATGSGYRWTVDCGLWTVVSDIWQLWPIRIYCQNIVHYY